MLPQLCLSWPGIIQAIKSGSLGFSTSREVSDVCLRSEKYLCWLLAASCLDYSDANY
jgi:hypothetical protein